MNTNQKKTNVAIGACVLALALMAGVLAPSLVFAQGGGQTGNTGGTFSVNGIVNRVSGTVDSFFNRPVSTTLNVVTGTVTTVVGGAYNFVRNTYVDIRDMVTGRTSSFTPVNSGYSDPKKPGATPPSGVKPSGVRGTTGGSTGSRPTGSKGSVSNPISGGESTGGRSKNDPIRSVSPGTQGVGENNPTDDKSKGN